MMERTPLLGNAFARFRSIWSNAVGRHWPQQSPPATRSNWDSRHSPHSLRSDRFFDLDVEPDDVVVLVGNKLDWVSEILIREGFKTYRIDRLEFIKSNKLGDVKVSHLIVDLDYLGGIEKSVGGLRRIRDSWPDIVVVLLSSDFRSDDVSCDRLAVGDVCLKHPVGLASLEFGLMEASRVNNRVWQARCADMKSAGSEIRSGRHATPRQ